MKIDHTLKTLPRFFKAVAEGRKPFEIRRTDRHFEVGQTIVLSEVDETTHEPTGQVLMRRITYVALLGRLPSRVTIGRESSLVPQLEVATTGGELAVLGLAAVPAEEVEAVR